MTKKFLRNQCDDKAEAVGRAKHHSLSIDESGGLHLFFPLTTVQESVHWQPGVRRECLLRRYRRRR